MHVNWTIRLLLRKLSPQDHERYDSFILPKLALEFTLKEIVEKLKSLFGTSIPTFCRRYNCLQTKQDDNEYYLDYSCKENKAYVDFKMSELTEERFKCVIYVLGKHFSRDAEICLRLINEMHETSNIRLSLIVDPILVKNGLVGYAVDYISTKTARVATTKSVIEGNKDIATLGLLFLLFIEIIKQHYQQTSKPSVKKHWKKHGISSKNSDNQPCYLTMKVLFCGAEQRGAEHRLQRDTGSDISIISHQTWITIGRLAVKSSSCRAQTETEDPLKLISELECNSTQSGIPEW
uniref:Peptidase A2 domain-containing protein n=1 Tax=Anopheles dirus TaxID=7168 RepID=A0A182N2X4_9DIPT